MKTKFVIYLKIDVENIWFLTLKFVYIKFKSLSRINFESITIIIGFGKIKKKMLLYLI